MENKSTTTYNKAMYVIIGLSLLAIIYFNFIAGNTGPKINHSTNSGYSHTTTDSSSTPGDLSSIPVSTTIQKSGEFYVITTKVRNNKSYSINEKLNVYVEDSTGSRKFVDMIYVELGAGELGTVESKIKTTDAGPPPHDVITEWK
jgi:hypothetical protein